jgi:DNA-binding transcriptional LysR family regulator
MLFSLDGKMKFGLDDIAVFLEVVRAGSFSGAAQTLRMPVSTVSRRVAALEARLGVQLLKRTTRALSLTEDGGAFAERCGVALAEVAAAANALADRRTELVGTLRVTAPHYACNRDFGPQLLAFAAQHPKLQLDLRLTNGAPDLVEEGVDVAFQLTPLPVGRHIARRLWEVAYVVCASRSLVEARPTLARMLHPRDLSGEPCVLTPPIGAWLFERPDRAERLSFAPRVLGAVVDDLGLGAAAVRQGLGVGYLPRGLIADDDFVELQIAGWRPQPRELYALYPASRQLSPKVRALIDHALAARAAHG